MSQYASTSENRSVARRIHESFEQLQASVVGRQEVRLNQPVEQFLAILLQSAADR